MRRFALLALTASMLIAAGCGDDGDDGPETVSPDDLSELASDIGHEVYWAGERPDTRIEVEQTSDGLVYVRYVPAEGDVDEEARNNALTIGTYPRKDALAEQQRLAKEPRTFEQDLPGGGIMVLNRDNATSAYIAYPDKDLQIEIYDPDPATVLELALSGEVVPVP